MIEKYKKKLEREGERNQKTVYSLIHAVQVFFISYFNRLVKSFFYHFIRIIILQLFRLQIIKLIIIPDNNFL